MAEVEQGDDIISNIPQELKSSILSYISTRNAVQTCLLLSQKWQSTWALIPEISISKADFGSPNENVPTPRSRFIRFVDVLLDLHNGPITKFGLHVGTAYLDRYFRDALEGWITYLSRRDEFRELSVTYTNMFKFPNTLFYCSCLKSLKLYECRIELPTGFQGFKFMSQLELKRCMIAGDDLHKLVATSPVLDDLVIQTGIFWIYNTKICAPKLKTLVLHGRFTGLLLEAPCLIRADLGLEIMLAGTGHANLAVPEIESLSLHNQFFAYIAADWRDRLPCMLDKLRVLELEVNLASHHEARLTLILVENCANIRELIVTSSTRDTTLTSAGRWQIFSGHFCTSLRVVKLRKFSNSLPAIAFLKYLVGIAPLLEEVAVAWEHDMDDKEKESAVQIVEQMPKASISLQLSFE